MADRELGVLQPKSIDFFFNTSPRANEVLDRMLSRKLNVTKLARYCSAINARIPGGRDHVCVLGSAKLDRDRDHYRVYTETEPHFSLTNRERDEAQKILHEKMGVPENAEFICFSSRSNSYLQHLHRHGEIRSKEELMQLRNPRNSSIEKYLPAARELAEKGYYLLRMGAVVDQPLGEVHPSIIDYATHYRTELLDIYLCSACRFFLSDTAGIHCVPFMFRRPVANANLFSFSVLNTWGGVFIPKKYKIIADDRYMTVKEIITTGGGTLSSSNWESYARINGVEYVENTPEEIAELALEMDGRIRGTWNDSPEDEERQAAFWAPFEGFPFDFGGPVNCRVATTFLRANPELIELV